jgi:hypothetical protein
MPCNVSRTAACSYGNDPGGPRDYVGGGGIANLGTATPNDASRLHQAQQQDEQKAMEQENAWKQQQPNGALPSNGWCPNPFDASSQIPCGDAEGFLKACKGGSLHDELNCEGEDYYEQYFIAYVLLQLYFKLPRERQLSVDPIQLERLVLQEYQGIWGDIYVDNTKRKLLPGVNERAADEHSNIHLFTVDGLTFNYSDLGLGNVAPGVDPQTGKVDFYNVYGYAPLKLSDFANTNA